MMDCTKTARVLTTRVTPDRLVEAANEVKQLFSGMRDDLILSMSYDSTRLDVHLSAYANGLAALDSLPGDKEIRFVDRRYDEVSKMVNGVKYLVMLNKEMNQNG